MVNYILNEINEKGWFILFQWQMEDGKLCVLFRRVRNPNFIVAKYGYDESRIYGSAQVDIAWTEKFIKENNLENKWEKFHLEKERKFREMSNKYPPDDEWP